MKERDEGLAELDPSEIVGVRSYSDRGSYNRMVEIYLRNGESHRVVAAHSRGSELASVSDAKRDEWLSESLGDLLDEPRSRHAKPSPAQDRGTSEGG